MARWQPDQAQIRLTSQRLTLPLVRRTTQEIFSGARRLAPEGDHRSGSGKQKRSKTLQASLYSSVKTKISFVDGRVGARTAYAASVHQGSKAHTIRSKNGKMLKFRWDRGDFLVAARVGRRRGNRRTGQFHFFVRVHHPGNKRPVRYLTQPLLMFGRLNGFAVMATAPGRTRLP